MARPSNLLYGLDDTPPLAVTLLSGLQQAAMVAGIGAVFPLLVLAAAGADPSQVRDTLAVSMLALGITTALQGARLGPVGSGFLAPAVFTAAYLPSSIMAAKIGGLPLVLGMTIFAGLCEILLSRVLHRLRPYLPAEIAGFAVAMIGIVLGLLGFRLIFGVDAQGEPPPPPVALRGLLLGGIAFGVMIGLNIWSKSKLKLYCVLIGMAAGYLAAWPLGMLDVARMTAAMGRAPFSIPTPADMWPTFDFSLALAFAIGAIACTLRAVGDLTTCQKINDTEWQRPDMATIRGGVLADGIGTTLCGVLGTVGLNTFSGSIGLSVATGITARVVGFATGGALMALAFVPQALDVLGAMPRPVMGAALVFSGTFIVMNGLQVILSRLMDSRKIVVIGLSLIIGLSRDMYPHLFDEAPAALQPVLGSSMVLAIASALLLNLLFRLGIHKRVRYAFPAGHGLLRELHDPLERQGAEWGARRDVWDKVMHAFGELADLLPPVAEPQTLIAVDLAFDEYGVDAEIRYTGQPLTLADAAPSHEEMLESDDALHRLSSFMLTQLASRVRTATQNGEQVLKLHFDH
ncbi:MAG TPA: solute carrier family 23 protein [Azospirillum sp.]